MAKRMARVLISSGLLMAGSAAPVYAGAWNYSGRTQLSSTYDDNILLSAGNQYAPILSATAGAADVSGRLQFQDDTLLWQLDPRFLATRYNGEQALNHTEKFLTMLTQFTGERSINALTLTGTEDTTLTSEIGLTGLSAVNKKHRTVTANLNSTWRYNEFIDGGVQLSAYENRYFDKQGTGLVDYDYGTATVNANYRMTERSQFFLQTSVGKLQVPDLNVYDKTNLSAVLGYSTQFSQRWLGTVYYGPSQVRANGSKANGTVYSASLSRKSELTNLSMSYTRDVTPTGYGQFGRRDQVQLALNQPLSERWATNWTVTSIRTRYITATGNLELNTVNYGDVAGNLSWSISPTWTLSLTAGYTRQTVQTVTSAAERNHAALNISWNGLMHRLN